MKTTKTFLAVFHFFLLITAAAQTTNSIPRWGHWQSWGDLGNNRYKNPILPADYSDPDCIRVGNDYYAISSTLQYSPGMVVLHSKDMVNWKIIGHAVNDIRTISPELNWDRMNQYGRGIWAGAIRYHDNKYWVYFGTPDEGYFMTTAKNPEGPWEPLHHVLKEKGWDDCCPFWDDDGQGYLIGTKFSDGYKIHLFKMTLDGKDLIKVSDKVIYQSKGSEANKLYKINGLYYHLFSEVKPEGRALMMERSKNIYGPYTEVKQLSHAQKEFNEPNQGGLVQTPKGDWYFLTHHGTGDWSGRILSLLPVHWIDGWPIIGAPGPDTIGQMVWHGKKPVEGTKTITIQTSDEFNATTLPVQWEWNYYPRMEKWSLTERKGWLRLHAFKPLEIDNLAKAGNTITQRTIRTATNGVIIKMDIAGMTDGQKGGLCHFGSPHYSSLGIACNGGVRTLEFKVKDSIVKGPVIKTNIVWLKSTWGLDGRSQYYYSLNGKTFIAFGPPYQLMWGSYRGDRIGIYTYNKKEENGYMDVDFFRYRYGK
jgi:beta-xylosidase